mgnify:CR=1 FL=1
MSASTTKKVLLERFDRERIRGYVNPHSFLQPEGVEILLTDSSVGDIPYPQIKAISFVRDLDGAGVLEERREFLARPKTVGLWVELVFRDGDRLEGVLPNNLLTLESSGYSFTPPETSGNAQRVFVPRQALEEIAVLGVVGGRRRMLARGAESQQIKLFSEE